MVLQDDRIDKLAGVLKTLKDADPDLYSQVIDQVGLVEPELEEKPQGYVIDPALKAEFEARLAKLPKGEGGTTAHNILIQEFRKRGYDRSRDTDAYPARYLSEQAAQQAQIAAHQAEQNKPYTPPDPGQAALLAEFQAKCRAVGSAWEKWQILQQYRKRGLKV